MPKVAARGRSRLQRQKWWQGGGPSKRQSVGEANIIYNAKSGGEGEVNCSAKSGCGEEVNYNAKSSGGQTFRERFLELRDLRLNNTNEESGLKKKRARQKGPRRA